MNPRHLWNRSAPAHVDIDLVGLQNFIVDHNQCSTTQSGLGPESPYNFSFLVAIPLLPCLTSPEAASLRALIRFISTRTSPVAETIFRASAGNMDRIGARHQRLCRNASRIHAGAAKLMAFDNRDGFSGTRKPRRQRRARLARPDDDCVEVLHRLRDSGCGVHHGPAPPTFD